MKGQDFDKALGRIISTLLALGMLAERASGARCPVRCLVLLILKTAEAAAGGFVREVALTPPGLVDCPAFPHDNDCAWNDRAGLLRLALRFRALAAALGHMLSQPRRFAQDVRQGNSAAGAPPVVRRPNGRAPALPESTRLPGSRAPPFRVRKGRKVQLQSRNGCLERLGASGWAAPKTVPGSTLVTS